MDPLLLPRQGLYEMTWSGRRFADGVAQNIGPVEWQMSVSVVGTLVTRIEPTPARTATVINQWRPDGVWAVELDPSHVGEVRPIRLLLPGPLREGAEWSAEYERNGTVDRVQSQILGPAVVKVARRSLTAIVVRRQHTWSGRVEGVGIALEYMVPELGVGARDVMRGVTTIDGHIVEQEEEHVLVGLPERQ
jgi:hypothetical protein